MWTKKEKVVHVQLDISGELPSVSLASKGPHLVVGKDIILTSGLF